MRCVQSFFVIWMLLVAPMQVARAQGENSRAEKCVALTFDDGPDKILTPHLLAILREGQVRATFYLIGSRVVRMPGIVADIQRDGHEIGNHSWDHPNFTKIPLTAIKRQIEMTDNAIAAIVGVTPRTTRPPYGAIDGRVYDAFPQRIFVLWDVDTLDWRYRFPPWMTKRVVSKVRNRSIVLMHDIHVTTVMAIPGIIAGLKSLGYTFVTVSELREGRCA